MSDFLMWWLSPHLHGIFNEHWRNILSSSCDDQFLDTTSDLQKRKKNKRKQEKEKWEGKEDNWNHGRRDEKSLINIGI